jgi:hypothetical protein
MSMKIEYALHNAIPTLVVEKREDGWYASVEIDWADSYEGTMWPASVLGDDDMIDGKFVDWVTARGEVGVLGAAACNMELPQRIEVGKIPTCFVAASEGDDGKLLAFEDAYKAAQWSRGYAKSAPVTITHFDQEITEEQVVASTRRSIEED